MDLRRALGLDQEHIGQEENTVSYEIYPAASAGRSTAELEALRTQLLDHLLPSLSDYIWQRDRFTLHLSTERVAPWQQARRSRRGAAAPQLPAQAEAPPHLWGCTSFGDNIEDEWFIVWLLLEATRAFPVTARVWDNDGEFLLIEAAYALPRWLKPETAQNRVWLHGGTFQLVPLPRFAGDPLLGATPSLAQALAAVQGAELDTAAPAKVQAALLPRVSGYPSKAAEEVHVAHALVPARVAHLLRSEPQLLAAAVEAFHYRDVDDVKAAARMSAFPPQDLVLTAARFSRCLYAQLALQEFAPPRGYPMPMPTDPQYKAAEVGMKLTAGFEMMFANRARFGRADDAEVQQAAAPADAGQAGRAGEAGGAAAAGGEAEPAGDAGWVAFRARLQHSGYFQDTLPGSLLHTKLLAAAVRSYQQTAAYRASTAALVAPALRVEQLLSQPVDPASFPPASELPPEGSEAWLQAGAEAKLEAELAQRQAEQEAEAARKQQRQQARQATAPSQRQQQRQGGGSGDPDGGEEGEEDFDPGELAGKLRAFMDMMAGLEGAEVPGEAQRGAAGAAGAAGGGGGVAFDEAQFAAELQRVLGLSKDALRGLERRAGGEDGWSEESSDEGSSFFSDGDEDDSDLSEAEEPDRPAQQQQQQQQHQQRQGPAAAAAASGSEGLPPQAVGQAAGGPQAQEQGEGEGWEADTGTDSDDDAQFLEAYGRAMDAQLASTRMAESFERAPVGATPQQQQQQQGSGAGGAPAAVQAAGGEPDEAAAEAAALRPVDVDLNLVNSLLASYGEQHGLPGPASNLAGLLGLKLPDQSAS